MGLMIDRMAMKMYVIMYTKMPYDWKCRNLAWISYFVNNAPSSPNFPFNPIKKTCIRCKRERAKTV